jgi:lipoic acid synthetase
MTADGEITREAQMSSGGQMTHEELRKPAWLKRRLSSGSGFEKVRALIDNCHLHTVCQEAKCPNIWECFSRETATFLILGDRCTRNCRFCAVAHGPESLPDPDEPEHVASAVQQLKLAYVVITSVTRDDLPDGGAHHFAKTIQALRNRCPKVSIEVLIPDFQGNHDAWQTVLESRPDVLNHNLETIQRLYPTVRPEADYNRSLDLIRYVSKNSPGISIKSGLMLGLGETRKEVVTVFADLIHAGCHILTMGQYLRPSTAHLPVARYVPPEEFEELKNIALEAGFRDVAAEPFVRSSYRAKELFSGKSGG